MQSHTDSHHHHPGAGQAEATLSRGGYRLTPQRRVVLEAIQGTQSHPTAQDVFMSVKSVMPTISLATVYNCLETLVEVHLIRQVNMERESTRYCANMHEHAHFFCNQCGTVVDAPLVSQASFEEAWMLPETTMLTAADVVLRGLCADCAAQVDPAAKPALTLGRPKRHS
jgi:Fe2+ or Zn2+ uptake regulation protein